MIETKIVDRELLRPEHLALSPLDGRYWPIARKLEAYFSEYALMEQRVKVEVYYLKFLLENISECKIFQDYTSSQILNILDISINFGATGFLRIKEIESTINHDVKAVELFVAEELEKLGFSNLKSFVHIGCTSEDITNLAYASMIQKSLHDVWSPHAESIIDKLNDMAGQHSETSMLAHTHGQPATPTTIGKELYVYVYRLESLFSEISCTNYYGKFNGATGNYSAISIAFPNENWAEFSEKFVTNYLGLDFNPITTQIESHDYMCSLFDKITQFNNIVLGLDLDMWTYISMDFFKLIPKKDEVGSSTMPHKVNPINFENSEANITISNALFKSLSDKLSRSRMQRDLSDSSAQRNIGIAFGYSIQALSETLKGLNKVCVNQEKLESQLNDNWIILAEPIQTMLRKYGIPDAYNQLKDLTRGKQVSKKDIHNFINTLDCLSEQDKVTLLELTPAKYIGYAAKIVEYY